MNRIYNILAFAALVLIYVIMRIYYFPNPFRTVYAFAAWRRDQELVTDYRNRVIWMIIQAAVCWMISWLLPLWAAVVIVLTISEIVILATRKFKTAIEDIEKEEDLFTE